MIDALNGSETSTSPSPYSGIDHDDSHEVALRFLLASAAGSVCVSVSPRKVVLSYSIGYLRRILTDSVGKKCVDRGFNTRGVIQDLTTRTVSRRKIMRYLIS